MALCFSTTIAIAATSPSCNEDPSTIEDPFVYPELTKGIAIREEREGKLLELRAKARNRIFLLQQRLKRREVSQQEFGLQMQKLKEAVNLDAQALVFGVPPEMAAARDDYLSAYGCAKWSANVLERIAELGPVVELGAGNGQWKRALEAEHDVDIVAYDDFSQLYFASDEPDAVEKSVLEGDEKMLRKHHDRTLLLVCPPPTDMAARCLNAYSGNRLVFVGEGRGGAHGNEAFFAMLKSGWDVVDVLEVEPFSECFEKCYVMERKARAKGFFGLW